MPQTRYLERGTRFILPRRRAVLPFLGAAEQENGTAVAEEQKQRQIVSRERVRAHGEVYTAEREVNAMLDLVKAQSEDDGSTFLEPACGDGNFLVAILRRKLAALRKKYRRSSFDFEFNSLLVLGLLYGVDILPDNVTRCRRRLFDEWTAACRAVRKKPPDEALAKSAAFILERNVVCGNALSMMCVDAAGKDTKEPIVFSEWKRPTTAPNIQRTDYTMNEMLAKSDGVDRPAVGPDAPKPADGELLAESQAKFPKPIRRWKPKDYRRIWEDAES